MKLLVNLLMISITLGSKTKETERKAYFSMTGKPGSYCRRDKDCKMKKCDLSLKRSGFGTCLGGKGLNAGCAVNYECLTGNCDYRTSQCKAKGSGREDGNDCKKNSDCDSGLCGDNQNYKYTSKNGLSNFGCYSVGEPGAKCLHHWECTVRCDFDKNKPTCAAKKGEVGKACAVEEDCMSNFCVGGITGFGKCELKYRNGRECITDDDCQSNNCEKTNDCESYYSHWFKKRVTHCKTKCMK